MKRFLCALLAILMVASLCSAVMAEEADQLMLYDGEGDTGNGFQDPWGQLAGCDYDYYTEGEAGYAVQSFSDRLMFFQDIFSYNGNQRFDLTGYEYLEFDLMSYYDMTCDFEVSIINNLISHHGNDIEIFDIFLPAETFVHFKLPLKDFVVYDQFEMDTWDMYATENLAWEVDDQHYGGPAMDCAARLRWQFTFCKTGDMEELPCDDIYMVFDNVTVTKNGAGEESTLQYWADVKPTLGQDDPQPVVSNTDVTPTQVTPGDVDNNGIVNAGDALLALKYAVGKQELTDGQKRAADMDANGVINAADALMMLKIAVGKG